MREETLSNENIDCVDGKAIVSPKLGLRSTGTGFRYKAMIEAGGFARPEKK
jgi:hypothetical protein